MIGEGIVGNSVAVCRLFPDDGPGAVAAGGGAGGGGGHDGGCAAIGNLVADGGCFG